MNLTAIGFDADDTLWQNETFFRMTEERFKALLADFADPDHIGSRLLDAERRNLDFYGFGIKGFVLSMIETAVEITEDRVPSTVIHRILEYGREMMRHPVETLPHARDAVEFVRSSGRRVILVTKGDLFDQERKLAQSGLGELFDAVEIVSGKTADTYASVFARHADGADRAMMIGNSVKSDVLPAIEAGAWGVHVPHPLTWVLEHVEAPEDNPRFRQIGHLGELDDLLREVG